MTPTATLWASGSLSLWLTGKLLGERLLLTRCAPTPLGSENPAMPMSIVTIAPPGCFPA